MERVTAFKSETASASAPVPRMVQTIIGNILAWLGIWVIPSVVVVAFGVLIWQNSTNSTQEGTPLPIAVWESDGLQAITHPSEVQTQLARAPVTPYTDTQLSTREYWFSVTASAPKIDQPWAIDFPSRHATNLTCWDRATNTLLGTSNRSSAKGQLTKSRAGFAMQFGPAQAQIALVCSGEFEGPARIAASVWHTSDLDSAELAYKRTGGLIDGGIGVLAVFMLLTALVNRSALYWVFFGWLALSLRMAALSAGTDFEVLGVGITPSLLVPIRQWTVGLYYAMAITLFSQLFKEDLAEIKSTWLLTLQQVSALAILPVCAFMSFKSTLPILWVGTVIGVCVMVFYLVQILYRRTSRVAVWYAASIAVSWIASLSEVIAASTGVRNVLGGLNSVTAAIASALFASLAVAEHIRSDRLTKLEVQKNLKTAYEDSPIGLFTLRGDGLIVKYNPVFSAMLEGFDLSGIPSISSVFETNVQREIDAMRESDNRTTIELQTRTHAADTSYDADRWFAIKASTTDGDFVEGSLQDITDKVRAMDRLEFLANHDPLTDCLNLRGIAMRVEEAAQQPTALAYFDLDRFKVINDLYGHTAGDEVLRQVCERMKSQLEPEDLLARVGGDEFVVAFPSATMSEAALRCNNLVALISSSPYVIDTQSFVLSVSGGLVETASFGATTIKELVSTADTVCCMAKKHPSERLRVVERGASFFKHHKEELEIISSLERGIAPEGLYLVMQPEMSLSAPFDSLNFEVLLRLRKSNGDEVPANVIIEAAEAHGKSAIIDRWVVTTIIAWLETHAHQLPNTQFVGVNLSGGSLNNETFVEELFALFEKHKAALSLICLEITETVALTDIQNMQKFIDRARAIGAKVGIDDFGAGYSSFGYLKNLSVDALKLDGSLVKGCANNPASTAIINALGGLVKNLGLKSIGEFAEDLPTIQVLALAGIDYAQGWGISKAVMPERILAARSCVDLIEDPAVVAFARQLQAHTFQTPTLLFEHFTYVDTQNPLH